MSSLRQALYGMALLGALTLLIWSQELRVTVADKNTELATKDANTAREEARRYLANASALQNTLQQERDAQASLRTQQDQLRQGLAKRELTIEALKRENAELRDWAGQPLPDAARRLRERPTLTGADAYRQWLSGRSALHSAGDQSAQ
ncbi:MULTISPECIES: Rz-like lysis system protein LysB [Pseudomonas]|uniref:Rz-like lysis system protein LysB n=1 Tax=Pseudomonas wuhanensis TaxID=2954098 RepID=A0ABY9GXX1_9PSED|nr:MULTISPECIES: Rz-like lysis system protein LysB [unclassified Pseudomonas]WLI14430.1 Rz-like lysis system protein LysB [Pseudomonas sp. FP603]WLI20346.1 Rz-like lysis system protein LysB [Pseudomonas sp. FP607]